MTSVEIEKRFQRARGLAAQRNLVVVREDGECLVLPALDAAAVNPQQVAAVERMLPSTIKRNVAVVGSTTWASKASVDLQSANEAIPFFGLLMGFATIGHAVWIFNGAEEVLGSGCQGADLLIVDSAAVPGLAPDWRAEVEKAMRKPQIFIHDRESYKLQKLV